MRTFVRLREMLSTHEHLRRKIDAMEKRYDSRLRAAFETMRQMLEKPMPGKSHRISRKIRCIRKRLVGAPFETQIAENNTVIYAAKVFLRLENNVNLSYTF
jgi:hypothetical protein